MILIDFARCLQEIENIIEYFANIPEKEKVKEFMDFFKTRTEKTNEIEVTFSEASCLIVAVMSHGGQGKVLGMLF